MTVQHTPNLTQKYITKWLLLLSSLAKTQPYGMALHAASRAINNKWPCSLGRYDSTFRPYTHRILVTARFRGIDTRYKHSRRITDHTNGLYITINKNTFQQTQNTSPITVGSWQQGGKCLLSELSSSLRTQTVQHEPCSSKASRRVRTTLYRTWYAWNEGGLIVDACITSLETPLMECLPCLGQGGDASRVTLFPTPFPQSSTSLALPVCVGVVSSSRTTKSLTGGTQNTWASETVASVQYVPFPLVGSSAVEVL